MILVFIYLTAIVAANLSTATFGPEVSILNAFLFIGLDLTSRDALHERWRGRNLWLKMFTLIASGSLLSYAINANAGPIALASFVAFAAAGVADLVVYSVLADHAYMVRVNGSNVFSAGVDSLVFPVVAFGFPVLWPIVAGQFIAKVTGGFAWSLLLHQPMLRDDIWKENDSA